jgi:hypothetical protein
VEGLRLPKNDSNADEVILIQQFLSACKSITEANGSGPDENANKTTIISEAAIFYTNFVVLKNLKRSREETKDQHSEIGTTATPTTAAKDMRKLAKQYGKPVVCFIGQALDWRSDSLAHCWSFTLWYESGKLMAAVKYSNGHLSGAKVPNYARKMAEVLQIEQITLVPASPEDRCSDEECLLLTYQAIADVLDGKPTVGRDQENNRFYDVTTKKYL